jgi:hypothetical protein
MRAVSPSIYIRKGLANGIRLPASHISSILQINSKFKICPAVEVYSSYHRIWCGCDLQEISRALALRWVLPEFCDLTLCGQINEPYRLGFVNDKIRSTLEFHRAFGIHEFALPEK